MAAHNASDRTLMRSIPVPPRCVAAHLPLLHQAAALVANVRVRNVGTLGGNLCFGDPHSDPAPVLLVYNTRMKIGQHGGARSIGLDEFYIGLYETAIAPDELVVEVKMEPIPPGVGSAYLRCARVERTSLAVAVATARTMDTSPMCGWP